MSPGKPLAPGSAEPLRARRPSRAPGARALKVFLSVDMEGIGGIVSELETDPEKGGGRYEESRRLMTREANAAIEGCLDAGAEGVLVADSHWTFDNLLSEDLHEAATLLRGKPRAYSMVDSLDASFDAALFVGYHAAGGAPHALP